jgi:hypothetical protein
MIPFATAGDDAASSAVRILSKLTLSPQARSKPGMSLRGVGGIRDMTGA